MTKEQAIQFLITYPYKFGHMIGFTRLSTLHNEWIISMLRGKSDMTLQASRETYKTTCVSIVLALNIILLPKVRTLFLRKTDNDVKEVITQVSKILKDEHTQYFVKTIYGCKLKLYTDTLSEIDTNLVTDIKGTHQLVGLGLGTSITGKHYDRIFTDDIVNVSDRISRAERERTKLIYQELQNVKNRGGKIVNTGTPWHEEDCFSIMPPAEKYDCYNDKIKEIISEEYLNELRQKMSPSLFSANYELRHIPSDEVMFLDPQRGASDDMAKDGWAHVDSAFYGEDFTAWTIAKEHDGKLYVYGKMKRKHVEDCYDMIINDYNRLLAQKILTETNADKGYVAKDLRLKGLRVQTYNEKENKYIKIVTYLKGRWSDIIFTDGTDDEYIKQITDFYEDAEHDDAPDSLASLIRAMPANTNNNYVSLWN